MSFKSYLQKTRNQCGLLNIFKYSNILQSEHVMIVGGGLSVTKSLSIIGRYIREYNPIIFTANYSYPQFVSHYVYFGDWLRFLEHISTVTSKNIIFSSTIIDRFKKSLWIDLKNKFNCYEVYERGKKHCNKISKWEINEDGTFPMSKIGPSGFALFVLSLICRPKTMFVVGVDGPIVSNKRVLLKYSFNGKLSEYGTVSKYNIRKKTLEKSVLPLVLSKGVKILCSSHCPLWNIKKKRYGIIDIRDII